MCKNKHSFIISTVLFLSFSNAIAQDGKEIFSIPKMSSNISIALPVNLYCKPQEKIGYFKFNNNWLNLPFPIKNEIDFTLKIKSWSQLTRNERKVCSLYDNEYNEADTKFNTKLCVLLDYPSRSGDLIPKICTPHQYKEGPVYLNCPTHNTVIDIFSKSVFSTPSVVELLFNNAQSITRSSCTEIR
jgi:hypothetical protein